MRTRTAVLAWCCLAGPAPLAAQARADPPAQSASAVRNPGFLRAMEILEPRQRGGSVRVRFEWEQVPGTSEYILHGRWTEAGSWAVRASEVRVTPKSAAEWDARRVTVELPLEPGTHSWTVVALRERELGDFAHPARLTFDVR